MKKNKYCTKPSLSCFWHVFTTGGVKADLGKVRNIVTLIHWKLSQSLKIENCCHFSSERQRFNKRDTSTSLEGLVWASCLKDTGLYTQSIKVSKTEEFSEFLAFYTVVFSGDAVCSQWGASHGGKSPGGGRSSACTWLWPAEKSEWTLETDHLGDPTLWGEKKKKVLVQRIIC